MPRGRPGAIISACRAAARARRARSPAGSRHATYDRSCPSSRASRTPSSATSTRAGGGRGPPGAHGPHLAGVHEQLGVAEAPRHLEAGIGQRLTLVRADPVVELGGHREQHPAAQLGVLLGQAGQRPTQRVDDDVVLPAVSRRLPQRAAHQAAAGLGEQPDVAELVGHPDRRLDDLDQVQPVAGPAVHLGQLHQQPVAVQGGGLGVQHDGVERRREQLDRRVGGVPATGHASRGRSGPPGATGVRRAGGLPVPGHLALPAGPRLEHLGHAGVHPRQPGRTRRRGHRVAHQRVGEGEAVGARPRAPGPRRRPGRAGRARRPRAGPRRPPGRRARTAAPAPPPTAAARGCRRAAAPAAARPRR